MSKDVSSTRRIHLKPAQSADENEFESPWNQAPLILSRAPLNSIPDPSQYPSNTPTHLYKHDSREKPDISRASDSRKTEVITETQLTSSLLKTPGIHGRGGKALHSEPNSAQSTPIRSGHRFSNIGTPSGSFSLARLPSQSAFAGGRGGTLSRVPRSVAHAIPQQFAADVQHFELDEDISFWKDHNLQVLIRIRPLNNMEVVSQGLGRCLRQETAQTVVWLGHPETRFTFDHIAGETISQEKLFRVAGLPMVDNCMSGYNSCMFAYGQTGSGKTFTMMGEIDKMDGKLSDDCGITPRVFEYLFSRITKEEESRKHERLSFSCKCSFLEIYNEQITDLLEPSSANLQLREDSKKGVYVENLTEYSVRTVNDVLRLLQQGAANRKIAATHMNSESSRSHSVFTCIIESHWEKDSMAHLRFGRLNLVDLAGSERQKSSGAEGDRLKEAANINKSLSTLGLVIMSLVDLAQGKQRHIPYRDSRLTFLLQDSLGGNSKTTIIANVCPSTCSANETLSTLKFAQRAKLIQNNAKINEDASGNVIVLQQQIKRLKDQLSLLMMHEHAPMKHLDFAPSGKQSSFSYLSHRCESDEKSNTYDGQKPPVEGNLKINHSDTTLSGALRREKLADLEVRRLKAEIEHLNHLSNQQQEEAQRNKTMLRIREERIKRLELLMGGIISAEKFYQDENAALREENLQLQAKINGNPEVIRCALENIRLLEQIRLYQNFYDLGERESLLAEISELRDQLLASFEAGKNNTEHDFTPTERKWDLEVSDEFKQCQAMNSELLSEVNFLRDQLANRFESNQDAQESTENQIGRRDSVIEVKCSSHPVDEVVSAEKNQNMKDTLLLQLDNLLKQLIDVHPLTPTMKPQQFQLIKELHSALSENQKLLKTQGYKKHIQSEVDGNDYNSEQVYSRNQDAAACAEGSEGCSIGALQNKLDIVSSELKEAQRLNRQVTENYTTRLLQDRQIELVRNEVEMETTKTIMHLQQEIDGLQSEFQVRLCSLAEQNLSLRNTLAAKEDEVRILCEDWERATLELTTFLADGSRSLGDASHQIKCISSSFPNDNDQIGEHVEKAAKICIEKEETIMFLQNSLEEALTIVKLMEHRLSSLRGATVALTGFQQLEDSCREKILLVGFPDSSFELREFHKSKSKFNKDQFTGNPDNATSSMENKKSDHSTSRVMGVVDQHPLLTHTDVCAMTEVDIQITMARTILSETEDAVNRTCSEAETYWANLKSDIHDTILVYRELLWDLLKEVSDIRRDTEVLKGNQLCQYVPSVSLKQDNQMQMLEEVRNELGLNSNQDKGEAEHDQTASQGVEAGKGKKLGELAVEEMGASPILFSKFEEAYATIKEADCILKAMVKANENAKRLTARWKQAGEELIADKGSLTQEIEQLKSCILLREEEKEVLQEETKFSLAATANGISLLEECFLHMRTAVEEFLDAAHGDATQVVKGTKALISTSTSSVEDLTCKTMQNDIIHYVLQCQMRDYFQRFRKRKNVSDCERSLTQEHCLITDHFKLSHVGQDDTLTSNPLKCGREWDQFACASGIEIKELNQSHDETINANSELEKELERKEVLLKGLLFDFSLLQEFASHRKDIKDELEKLVVVLAKVQEEVQTKTLRLDGVLVQKKELENQLAEAEEALLSSNSELEREKKTPNILSEQNDELRNLVKDLSLKNSDAMQQVEEQREAIEHLEEELIRVSSSSKHQLVPLSKDIGEALKVVTAERDQLLGKVRSLQDRLDMACAVAEENQAIAVEARQESEASKMYAEQKQEEVKILERSVEELDCTINVLEKKVHEMEEEIKKHRLMKDSLELELQELKFRLIDVEDLTESITSEKSNRATPEDHLSRNLHSKSLEITEANNRIRFLEEENTKQAMEIKQLKDHSKELVLHADAQASQYHQKYKILEAMLHETKKTSSNIPEPPASERADNISTRTRGSSSPFRCITGLVQQMNQEKDQELSIARRRVQELEELAANKHKEVCVLNTRLATTESMTHDVIRDLLSVKLDISNYANIIEQQQLQKLIQEAQHQGREFVAMEQEIINLRSQIDELLEERERFLSEIKRNKSDQISTQILLEQLRERDQLLIAQNDMLKIDKSNLQKRIVELDDMAKKLLKSQHLESRDQPQLDSLLRPFNPDLDERLSHSQNVLSRINNQLTQYLKPDDNCSDYKLGLHGWK